ncbi:outer membrane protease [Agrobacterium salinitolerans]|uniref:omptin family outer membrane protease n=1 Tax=Agrobacterium salinitolerans TaxID=1183413 RepID=UPI00098F5C61|nr:omptin family outer membrane protease [Agrobacterium salinitolerans]OOO26843.1 outer membrane protease [Agrobacterium salinitolerans]PNQ25019.1 outer membrane protease [Rhizobium sp. YIC5082]
MPFSRFSLPLSAALAISTTVPAMAEPGGITASLDAGVLNIKATETLYSGSHKNSQLDWKTTNAMALRGSLGLELSPDWRIKTEGRIGFAGDGYMTDYDWLYPYYKDTSKEGWSHRSQHGDTRLDHYLAGSIELNRTLLEDPLQHLSAGIGFRYTDVQWSSYGGSYIYSSRGFRNYVGDFGNGEKAITYRQQIPVFYGNLNGGRKFGNWSLNAGVEGGAMVYAKATDDHWMRSIRFTDKFDIGGMFGAKAGIAYNLTENASIYLDGAYEYTSFGRGDKTATSFGSGSGTVYGNAGGGDMQSLFVGMGVKGRF